MTRHDGWDGILDADEKILWQGRPDAALELTVPMLGKAAFGLMFMGIAVQWMIKTSQAGGYLWAFGLLHFSAGFGLMGMAVLGDSWRRRHTWYTLTNRRAFIATDMPLRGRKLRDYPITEDTLINFHDGHLPSVSFGFEPVPMKRHTSMREVGFEKIAAGADVFKMIQSVRSGRI